MQLFGKSSGIGHLFAVNFIANVFTHLFIQKLSSKINTSNQFSSDLFGNNFTYAQIFNYPPSRSINRIMFCLYYECLQTLEFRACGHQCFGFPTHYSPLRQVHTWPKERPKAAIVDLIRNTFVFEHIHLENIWLILNQLLLLLVVVLSVV